MTWFNRLTGLPQENTSQVYANLSIDDGRLNSLANGKTWIWGKLQTPSLSELRDEVRSCGRQVGKLSLREIVADVQSLHTNEANAGALFQVASQFNLLEMMDYTVTPEQGIGIYENDRTQGPACAIAAGAGTIYRNYFAVVDGQVGQSADNQIDCLTDIGSALGNSSERLWKMQNGYALATGDGLIEISRRLEKSSESEIDQLRQKLRIGIQWNTQVTLNSCTHLVTQTFCSALPVRYSRHRADLWEAFARLILEAAYEATICVGILNAKKSGNKNVFLTLLGGGAFGNETDWITAAIRRTVILYKDADLDVAIVSYRDSNRDVRDLVDLISE